MSWDQNELVFQPAAPFSPAESYQMNLSAGFRKLAGAKISKNITCAIMVRQPQIIYQTVNLLQGEWP